jgi:hypothetical protein
MPKCARPSKLDGAVVTWTLKPRRCNQKVEHMGKFMCRCAQSLGQAEPDPWEFFLVPADAVEIAVGTPGVNLMDLFGACEKLHRCPNCGRLHWESKTGRAVYVRNDDFPRIWADLTDRDPLDGIRLRHPRTIADIERQRVLLEPTTRVTLFDGTGREITGTIEFGVLENGELDTSSRVVRRVGLD